MPVSSLHIAGPFRTYLVMLWLAAVLSACGSGGDSQSASVPEPPPLNLAPTLNFSANVSDIGVSYNFTLSWSSAHAKTCTASGDWSGTKALEGAQSMYADEAGSKSYTLTCSGDGGTIDASVLVNVRAPSKPPMQPGKAKLETHPAFDPSWKFKVFEFPEADDAATCTLAENNTATLGRIYFAQTHIMEPRAFSFYSG